MTIPKMQHSIQVMLGHYHNLISKMKKFLARGERLTVDAADKKDLMLLIGCIKRSIVQPVNNTHYTVQTHI